jgi:hypothetical protein
MREEWKQEWHGELWNRTQSGASVTDLFRCARGAVRDALWFRSTEYTQFHLASEGFLAKPLRPELALLAVALLLCGITGAFRAPQPTNANARRAVRLERGIGFLGALDLIFQRELLLHAKDSPTFEDVAAYHWSPWNLSGLLVSTNFFDILGAKPILGRTFNATDDDRSVILTESYWNQAFHRDLGIVGRDILLGGERHNVIGVVDQGLPFTAIRIRFYSRLEANPRFAGAIALLRPGVTLDSAQAELRRMIRKTKLSGVAPSLLVTPLWIDMRKSDSVVALAISLSGVLCGLAFVILKGLGGARYRFLLAARLFITLVAISGLRLALARILPGMYGPVSFFEFWIFLLVCCAGAVLVVRDHLGRCLVCFRRMLMPAPIGTWSSALLDQPATEYVCPAGHGTLYVAETGNAPTHWTVLDESWQDLFVHR